MIFICYPKCTTCQKARAWLDEHHITYNFRDIKLENPTYDELAAWHEHSGLPLKKFFNTSGLLYKSMGLKDKLPQMSEDEMLMQKQACGIVGGFMEDIFGKELKPWQENEKPETEP